jgi:hypothetical protein
MIVTTTEQHLVRAPGQEPRKNKTAGLLIGILEAVALLILLKPEAVNEKGETL